MAEEDRDRPTVLLVEDEDEVRTALRDLLEAEGQPTVTVGNEEEAVRIAERLCPELLIVNLPMPPPEVLAAGRRIRQQANLSDGVPVVVIADEFDQSLEGQDIRVGDHEYVSYTVTFEQLRSLINHLLHDHARSLRTR